MKTDTLQKEIVELKNRLEAKQEELETIYGNCNHKWNEIKPAHIYHEAYTIPGDEPGTMGVDWRGPCYVPPRTENRWKRVCLICGKIEFTKETTKNVTESPVFS